MPANLTPQYKVAEDRYRQAETPAEKLTALEDMLTIIPKHKGTEKIQADIKRRISKLKEEDEKKGQGVKHGPEYNVEKEGGGQVILVGPPNSGKSTLLSKLTKAQPEIGEYPFTTQRPLPGMMQYEDIRIQIVDLPAISEEFTEPWIVAIARNGDAVLLVVDASDIELLDSIETTLAILKEYKVALYGYDRGIPSEGDRAYAWKKTLMVVTKIDKNVTEGDLEVIRELYDDRFPIVPVSCETGENLDELKDAVFRMLDIVRVYTKIPGKPVDMKSPFILRRGSTVEDLTAQVHKEFVQKLRFARIWSSQKYDGQMVSRDHLLEDRDVIELHV